MREGIGRRGGPPRRHRWLSLACIAWVVASGPARADDLAGMSLEELMQLRIRGMAITNIHHTHDAGEWMLGLGAMFMHMDGNRSRTERVSKDEVLDDYMVAPTQMDMEMYMLGLMYAPTDHLTLMAMLPYERKEMKHVTRTGERFTTRSRDFGDASLTAMFSPWKTLGHEVVTEVGLSFPTGSIDEKDDTPTGRVRLPYPMQTGSGTWDVLLGLTYLGRSDRWAWGSRAGGTVRTGENDNDYTLGDKADVSAWLAREILSGVSLSGRLDWRYWGNIEGADPRLNPAMVPTADPDRRGGHRLDALGGLNLFAPSGFLKGHRLAIEGGLPLYQWLDGPQLESDYRFSVSWQWTFGR